MTASEVPSPAGGDAPDPEQPPSAGSPPSGDYWPTLEETVTYEHIDVKCVSEQTVPPADLKWRTFRVSNTKVSVRACVGAPRWPGCCSGLVWSWRGQGGGQGGDPRASCVSDLDVDDNQLNDILDVIVRERERSTRQCLQVVFVCFSLAVADCLYWNKNRQTCDRFHGRYQTVSSWKTSCMKTKLLENPLELIFFAEVYRSCSFLDTLESVPVSCSVQ